MRDHHSPATESELSQVIPLHQVFLTLGKGDVVEASGLLGFLEELETKRWMDSSPQHRDMTCSRNSTLDYKLGRISALVFLEERLQGQDGSSLCQTLPGSAKQSITPHRVEWTGRNLEQPSRLLDTTVDYKKIL